MTLFDLLLAAAGGVAGGGIGSALLTHLLRRRPPPEKTCTGYEKGAGGEQKHDCKAIRSAVCSDGRCALHCRGNCKCEAMP